MIQYYLGHKSRGVKPVATKTKQSTPLRASGRGQEDELRTLANVGPAMRRDFTLLGIESIAQLSKADPDELYTRLSRITSSRQDPCVWDTFAATIHQAKTGEARPWWTFTPVRKERQRQGKFL